MHSPYLKHIQFLHIFSSDILSIKTEQDLGDGVWEDVARALGYTSLEIDMKFKDSDEPFTKLLDDYKKRGGNANDFISAMYTVGRNANLISFEQRLRTVLLESGRGEVEDDVAACAGMFEDLCLSFTPIKEDITCTVSFYAQLRKVLISSEI